MENMASDAESISSSDNSDDSSSEETYIDVIGETMEHLHINGSDKSSDVGECKMHPFVRLRIENYGFSDDIYAFRLDFQSKMQLSMTNVRSRWPNQQPEQ